MRINLTILLLLIICGKTFAQINANIIYQSEQLVIKQLSPNTFQHISYLNTQSFGRVECNGLIIREKKQAIVVDTPIDLPSSTELIEKIKEYLGASVKAVIATHFHEDCLGGLEAFHQKNIPSYANTSTIHLADSMQFTTPQNSFENEKLIKIKNKNVILKYLGQGHTKDNIVVYFPSEAVLFGGCLVKEIDASKGYLGDANISEWPLTIQKVKNEYPDMKIVVPGHGLAGDKSLLDYTQKLFTE